MCCDFSRFLRVQNGCGVHCTASRICCYHIATNNVPSFIHKSKFDLAPSHITHIYANSSSITSLHRYKPPLLSACDCRPPLPGPYVRCLCSENGWHLFISAIRRIYGYNATIAAELGCFTNMRWIVPRAGRISCGRRQQSMAQKNRCQ